MRFNNIIFDFDGTLVDSRPGIVKSFKRVIEELSSKKVDDQEIIKLIGTPLAQMMSVLLETDDRALINKGSDLFRKHYQDKGLHENIICPGVKEMLEFLKEQSCQLFVVSNKIEEFMISILKQHDIKKYFTYIVGSDGTDLYSKKADYLRLILNNFKLDRNETVMVGDTESDIIAGKVNSIYCLGASWGYGQREDLIKAKADKIIDRPLELVRLIKKPK